jgi:putative DNA primase/helicase
LQELSEFRHSLHEAVVKQLTGGDPITVRLMCQEFFEYVPTFKIFLSTNYKPRIVGTEEGIWRRAKLVNFNAFFDEKQKDMNLPRKLFAEREGVMNWMIEGYKEWKRIGLATPECILKDSLAYRHEQDSLNQFVETCETGEKFRCRPDALYEAYKRWAQEQGEYVLSSRKFSHAMTERGWVQKVEKVGGKAVRFWSGIRVSSETFWGMEEEE